MTCDSDSPVGDLDLVLYIGDTFGRTFAFSSDGTPIDMSGQAPNMQLRTSPASSDVVADWSAYFSGDGGDGEFALLVPASEAAELDARAYSYDLQFVNGDYVRTYVAGMLVAVKDVTR